MIEDYLTEDTFNPPNQNFICVSFFSKNYVKQVINNNNKIENDFYTNKDTNTEVKDSNTVKLMYDNTDGIDNNTGEVTDGIDNNTGEVKDDDSLICNNLLSLKFRGAFSTYESACAHAKKLRDKDVYHNVYVMENGKWCPFKITDDNKFVLQTEYGNEELNQLMKSFTENHDKTKLYHKYRQNAKVAGNLNETIQLKRTSVDDISKEIDKTTDKVQRKSIKEKKQLYEQEIKKLEARVIAINDESIELEKQFKL